MGRMGPIAETTFQFRSYRTLNRSMGKVDAIIQANEVAIRRFLSEAEEAGDTMAFLKSMTDRYGTHLSDVDLSSLGLRVRHLCVVSTYQQAEDFLRRLKDEHPGSSEWNMEGKASLLKKVMCNLKPGYDATERVVGRLEVRVFDYYTRVRHRFIHTEPGEDDSTDKRLDSAARELREALEERGDFFGLGVPNGYGAISYDDFVLFTATVKRIARRLCWAGRPDAEEIVLMVERLDEQPDSEVDLKGFKKYKQSPDRLRRALAGMLFHQFNLSQAEGEPVVNLLLERAPLA